MTLAGRAAARQASTLNIAEIKITRIAVNRCMWAVDDKWDVEPRVLIKVFIVSRHVLLRDICNACARAAERIACQQPWY